MAKFFERKLTDILLVILFILGFFIGQGYEKRHTPKCPDQKVVYEKGKDVVKTVTKYVLWKEDKPTPKRTYKPNKPIEVRLDTLELASDDSARVYEKVYSDSNATITVTDSVQGKLLSQEIKAEIINRYTSRTDTAIVQVVNHRAIFGPYASVNIGEKTSIILGAVYSKGRAGYIAGYNLQNKYINTGIWYNLNIKR